jgi:hypothetical protein
VRAVPVARKLNIIQKRRKDKVVCFEGEVTETKATTQETVLDSSHGEDCFCCSGTK